MSGHLNVVQYLIEKGASIDVKDKVSQSSFPKYDHDPIYSNNTVYRLEGHHFMKLHGMDS